MRDFLKTVLATFLGLVLFTTLGVAGLAALLVAIVATTSEEPSSPVADQSVLTLDLSEEITDAKPELDPSEVVGQALSGDESGRSIALRSVLESIEKAATDDRIVGLYLYGNLDPTSSGFATLREVRQALEKFRSSGKPIYAYDRESWQERDYYLASVANQVIQNPGSVLEVNGFSLENAFFAGALQKYGIGVQVLRVGKYKSAVEPFIRSSSSPEGKEQTRKLLTDLWNDFRTATATSRKLTVEKIQAIADQQAVLLPSEAQAAGLIDKVAYEDEIAAELIKLTGEDAETKSYRQVSLADYADTIELEAESIDESANRVAVIYAEGEIVNGFGSTRSIGGDSLVETLREVRQDEQVKAVVLRVNSPGGSASASEQIAREVLLTTKVKPVIVSMGNYAASGGYQISTFATRIFASPTTVTGSIGVFGLLPNFQQIANNNGITWDSVKTGRYADLDSVARPKTPQELAIAQRVVNRIYDNFITIVSQSRQLPKQKVGEIAQGRVWSGLEAKNLGLVDELGGLEAAIQAAAETAKLGDDWQIEEYPKASSLWFTGLFRTFLPSHPAEATSTDPISLELQKFKADFDSLRSMNDPQGAYTRLPFNPWID